MSEGCRNCYAETIAGRFGRGAPTVYSGLTQIVNGRSVWTGEIKETKTLLAPLSWRPVKLGPEANLNGVDPSLPWHRSRRIFVNSMSALFHENVTDEQRDRIFAVMALCPQHVFQVLTKRPKRMLEYFAKPAGFRFTWREGYIQNAAYAIKPDAHFALTKWPLPNVWLGVSVENQATADERIPLLLQTPAEVRFISAEPLLGPVDLSCVPWPPRWQSIDDISDGIDPLRFKKAGGTSSHLDWVIAGGESGPHSRPIHPDWPRKLRDQCANARVPYFFKQWGEYRHEVTASDYGEPDTYLHSDGREVDEHVAIQSNQTFTGMWKVGKKKAGALLDGVEHREFPAVPAMLVDEPTAKAGDRQR